MANKLKDTKVSVDDQNSKFNKQDSRQGIILITEYCHERSP